MRRSTGWRASGRGGARLRSQFVTLKPTKNAGSTHVAEETMRRPFEVPDWHLKTIPVGPEGTRDLEVTNCDLKMSPRERRLC